MEVCPRGKSGLSPEFSVSSTQAFSAQPTLEIHHPSSTHIQVSEATASSRPLLFCKNVVHKVKDQSWERLSTCWWRSAAVGQREGKWEESWDKDSQTASQKRNFVMETSWVDMKLWSISGSAGKELSLSEFVEKRWLLSKFTGNWW